MAARRRGRDVHGILLLDKPQEQTSNAALQKVKRRFNARKAGHTGALDPFATGLLPICFGEATKISAYLLDADKSYRAGLRFGNKTDSGDRDGKVIESQTVPKLTDSTIAAALAALCGPGEQVPPMHSAVKVDGKRLYKHARAGRVIERPARKVTIHELSLVSWQSPDLVFDVTCSKGTYIRVLAETLAEKLGGCGHLVSLRRTAAEPFDDTLLHTLESLDQLVAAGEELEPLLLPVDAALGHLPSIRLNDDEAKLIVNGVKLIKPSIKAAERARVCLQDGSLLGIAELRENGVVAPRKMFPGLYPKSFQG